MSQKQASSSLLRERSRLKLLIRENSVAKVHMKLGEERKGKKEHDDVPSKEEPTKRVSFSVEKKPIEADAKKGGGGEAFVPLNPYFVVLA